jgi:aerobic-type carbon monoxide dehydrogenase small subunit (CoxS/CutS family)
MRADQCDHCKAKIVFNNDKLLKIEEAKTTTSERRRTWAKVRCRICGGYSERIAEATDK